jgi:hypothetical protein
MVGHFTTNIHMGVFVSIANIAQQNSIPKINPTLDLKVLDLYSPMKTLPQPFKMTKSIGLVMIKFGASNKVMLFGKER